MNEFINNFTIEPSSTALGKIGEYLFESKLTQINGLAYLNFNSLSSDNYKEIGLFLSKQKINMNYRKRSFKENKGDFIQIPFRFKEAPQASNLIGEILTASPVIDFLIIPPSDRKKVTLPREEDCIFLDVKTINKSDHATYSDKQKWVYYKYKKLNLYSLIIDVTLDHKIEFKSPNISYIPYKAPCGKELPNIPMPCHNCCSEYPCEAYIKHEESIYENIRKDGGQEE